MTLAQAQALDQQAEDYTRRQHFQEAAEAWLQASKSYDVAAATTTDASAARTLRLLAERAIHASQEAGVRAATHERLAQQRKSARQNDRHGQLLPKKRVVGDPVSALEASRRQLSATHQPPLPLAAAPPSRRYPMPNDFPGSAANSVASASMLESRITRRSNSPPSDQTPSASIFPEGSYMVLRDDMNSSDPFARFNNAVEALLGQVGNPVAFASLPLAAAPKVATPKTPLVKTAPPTDSDDIAASFFLVPSSNGHLASDSPAFLPNSHYQRRKAQSQTPSTKTAEELTLENCQLKENLDQLAVQFQKMVGAQSKERESLKHSILDLRRDIQRTSARRDTSMSMMNLPMPVAISPVASNSRVLELEKELDSLKQELHVTRLNAAKYKSRYDHLRDAIKRKKAGKDLAAEEPTTAQSSPSTDAKPSTTKDAPG